MDPAQSSFTPEVIQERIGISYKFTFPSSGMFKCSLTELVFNVTHEGEVKYKALIWDTMMLKGTKVPGGLLFDIKCPQESICQLHLPHCEPEPALVSESLSVVHITDDGMTIIKPQVITETHVVVDTPTLSAFGIVWDLIKRFKNFMTKPLRAQVLLFMRPPYRSGKLILSVILLPLNVPLQEVKVQHEDCEYAQVPSHCLLHMGKYYSLKSNREEHKIQPARADFFDNYGPNYHATFEINLTVTTPEVTMMVQDPDKMNVWEHEVHLRCLSTYLAPLGKLPMISSDVSAEEKLRIARSPFIDRVSYPVLNVMLDQLLSHRVINDAEFEATIVKNRADKARDLIDMVRKKGAEASLIMITVFSSNDPFLCNEIGLKAREICDDEY
ncbi:NACHT, LRR and PYD domains-containing protein 1b allele 2-like [Morone saxatilis]|uniref:NACHT, LRR and PYD domains-containing protein 1b allele 2-like n=1 Tax=Morone saxatilis TaxID=34816 RepID=UPI0015E1CE0F|nr:NACHT, LRR and PYD domains-containing protein 1b allele 2-like [Morone saxatilis]XP_035516921.1 NACHT, LRR and PYD domains-containing protein 1b allele 2-like [Morone saxatilis]